MVGWHHRLSGHGFGWTPVVGDGQGGLAYCGSLGPKESVMTELLNCIELRDLTYQSYEFCNFRLQYPACALSLYEVD